MNDPDHEARERNRCPTCGHLAPITSIQSRRKTTMPKPCEIDGCDRPKYSVKWCRRHFARYQRNGDVGPVGPARFVSQYAHDDIINRLFEQSRRVGTCIEWTGPRNALGYGTIGWGGKNWRTHRAAWTALVGPLPADPNMVIDHLCRNTSCMNVEHLEVVRQGENARRGGGLPKAWYVQATKTHCRNGHELTAENTITQRTTQQRRCRRCKADNNTRRAARQRLRRSEKRALLPEHQQREHPEQEEEHDNDTARHPNTESN